jgi:hypothetical protein
LIERISFPPHYSILYAIALLISHGHEEAMYHRLHLTYLGERVRASQTVVKLVITLLSEFVRRERLE